MAEPVVRQKRRWPWFVLGLAFGGGGGSQAANTDYQQIVTIADDVQMFTVTLDTSEGVGAAVGLWNTETSSGSWQIDLAGVGQLDFDVTFDIALSIPNLRWDLLYPADAVGFDAKLISHDLQTVPVGSPTLTLPTAKVRVTTRPCDGPQTIPLIAVLTDPASGTVNSVTIDVRTTCAPLETADD